jgi:hypothetical protein
MSNTKGGAAHDVACWIEERIETLNAARAKLLIRCMDNTDDLSDRQLDRLVSTGCKVCAYREVLNYIETHWV